jgi:hypothetical protein
MPPFGGHDHSRHRCPLARVYFARIGINVGGVVKMQKHLFKFEQVYLIDHAPGKDILSLIVETFIDACSFEIQRAIWDK